MLTGSVEATLEAGAAQLIWNLSTQLWCQLAPHPVPHHIVSTQP